ncbi:MAG: ATP-binding protein [Cyanobacteria bacterium J06638_38]
MQTPTNIFTKATKDKIKVRLALSGSSGSGKTYSALSVASHLATPIALIDTERGSSKKYADKFDFDVCELTDFHPSRYIQSIQAAEQAGYGTIIIDSLSHSWYWELDAAASKPNSFSGWKNVRPLERKLIDAIIGCRAHVIATMRTKTEWVVEKNDKGKAEPRKIGTTPVQTSSIEYEFDIAGEINQQHILTVTKSRCSALTDKTFLNPGQEIAVILNEWIGQPWRNWSSSDDAIAWAEKQLPDMPKEQLKTEFDSLPSSNGKKATAWVTHVYELSNQDF